MTTELSRLHEHLNSRRSELINTPSEIYSLPVGTILKAGRFGGLSSYNCIYSPRNVAVFLDEHRRTAVRDDLIILYRGPASEVMYRSEDGKKRVGVDFGMIVTVLGFNESRPLKRMFQCHWAFIDSL